MAMIPLRVGLLLVTLRKEGAGVLKRLAERASKNSRDGDEKVRP
jgi:hypothetical protein